MTTKQIGAAIRKARGTRSIRNVAEASGLNRHQVSAIEQGTTAYTMPTFLRLAKEVGASITVHS